MHPASESFWSKDHWHNIFNYCHTQAHFGYNNLHYHWHWYIKVMQWHIHTYQCFQCCGSTVHGTILYPTLVLSEKLSKECHLGWQGWYKWVQVMWPEPGPPVALSHWLVATMSEFYLPSWGLGGIFDIIHVSKATPMSLADANTLTWRKPWLSKQVSMNFHKHLSWYASVLS